MNINNMLYIKKVIYLFLGFLYLGVSFSNNSNVISAQVVKIHYLDSVFKNNNMQKIAECYYDNGWINFKPDIKITSDSIFYKAKKYFGLGIHDSMKLIRISGDENSDLRHYHYQQFYKGVKVDGIRYIIHSKNNIPIRANGKLIINLELDINPLLTESEAFQYGLSFINADLYAWENITDNLNRTEQQMDSINFAPRGELVITNILNSNWMRNSKYKIAYKFHIISHKPSDYNIIYVDANSGQLLKSVKGIDRTYGELESLYNGIQIFTTTARGWPYNDYILEDNTRGKISTKYFNYSYNPGAFWWLRSNIDDSDNYWSSESDKAAYSAQWAIKTAYDWFKYNLDWQSTDGNNKEIRIESNSPLTQHWSFNDYTCIQFGNHPGSGNSQATLDIAGHEFTHGIIWHTAELMSIADECYALKESFCDIMGNMVEYYASGLDWRIGEDSYPLRSMSNPHDFGAPDTYLEPGWWYTGENAGNWGEYNSGVQNKWFYLLTDGGSHNGVNVAGIGKLEAAKITFQNLIHYMEEQSNYIDARNGSIYAAVDEYGVCSNSYIQTINAWNAVNVPSDQDPEFNIINPCTEIQSVHDLGLPYSGTASNLFSANCQINDNKITTFKSGDKISLNPGFKSGKGSGTIFHAYILPCGFENKKANYTNNDYYTQLEENVHDINNCTNKNHFRFNIYPNPTSGILLIEVIDKGFSNFESDYYIVIRDLLGREIVNECFKNTESIKLNISNSPSGFYILTIKTSTNEQYTTKILKK